jgi:hypothetical protein
VHHWLQAVRRRITIACSPRSSVALLPCPSVDVDPLNDEASDTPSVGTLLTTHTPLWTQHATTQAERAQQAAPGSMSPTQRKVTQHGVARAAGYACGAGRAAKVGVNCGVQCSTSSAAIDSRA